MHPFFAPLTACDLGVLLVAITRAGREATAGFAHLPPERRAPMREKAEQLLQIPTQQRVALLVRELKAQLQDGDSHGIERMDPSWLAWAMQKESPQMVAVLLTSLPAPQVRSVLRRLPQALRDGLPPKAQVAQVSPELKRHLRRSFELTFAAMPPPPQTAWGLTDCVHLERRQLTTLIRDLGLIELGQAFASVGRMALLDLCRRLPRASADELVQAVRLASHGEIPEPKEAQRFLSRVAVNFENTEEFLQKAGLWWLSRATLGEPAGKIEPLLQRMPRRAALLVREFMAKAEAMGPLEPPARARLQDSVLTRMALLFSGTPESPGFGGHGIAYHDAAAAEAALREARAQRPAAAAPAVQAGGEAEPGTQIGQGNPKAGLKV